MYELIIIEIKIKIVHKAYLYSDHIRSKNSKSFFSKYNLKFVQ